MQTISKQALGTIIFLAGLFLGLALAVVAIWGDFEAMSYFYSGAGYPSFNGLSCPVLMSRAETGTVSATFNNPSNEEIKPYYQVEISGSVADRTLENQIPVAAHSSRTVMWTVNANDIDLGSFVLIKMDILPMAGYSTRETTCGIVVLNLGSLTGSQVLTWGVVLSLLGIVLGLVIRQIGQKDLPGRSLSIRNVMRAAGIVVCAALLAGLLGWWLLGLLLVAMTILLLVILLRMAVT